MEGMKKIKSTSFHQYSWNSEVETTWISLIGWHHKTSTEQDATVDDNLRLLGWIHRWVFSSNQNSEIFNENKIEGTPFLKLAMINRL